MEFYNNVIDECLKHGIVPFVTLYHWDLPQTLEEEGGWLNPKTADAFVTFADVCFRAFGDRVRNWITFNETVIFCSLGYLTGAHPPGIEGDAKAYFQATHNVFVAHARAVELFKQSSYEGKLALLMF